MLETLDLGFDCQKLIRSLNRLHFMNSTLHVHARTVSGSPPPEAAGRTVQHPLSVRSSNRLTYLNLQPPFAGEVGITYDNRGYTANCTSSAGGRHTGTYTGTGFHGMV